MIKEFKNGPSKICGWQLLKNLKRFGLPKQNYIISYFLKAVFHKFYLVRSWIPLPIYKIDLKNLNFYFKCLANLLHNLL